MLRSSAVVGFFSLLGSLSGILVETAIAARLGLSESSDVFYVAFTAPYIVTNLLSATGQFSLVPFFASLEARHSAEEFWRGFSYALNIVVVGMAAMAALGAVSAPLLVRGIAPGLTRAQMGLASELCPWLFLMIIPAGVAEVLRSFLLSRQRFALPSAAGLFRNVVVIACTVAAFDRYGLFSIVLGYLAGYLLQLLVLGSQLLIAFPIRYSLTLAGTGKAFHNLRGAGASQVAAAAGWQGVVVVERIIASFLPAGTLTALNFGFKILSTLAEILAGSVGTAALPALSKAVAREDRTTERSIFQGSLEIGLMLVAPVMVFCLMLSRNIMRLVFERGNFTPAATAMMSRVFFYYSLSLLAFAFIRLLTFALFARHEGGVYFRLSVWQYSRNILFDLFYVGALGWRAIGIPMGLLTSLVLTSGLLYRRSIGDLPSALDRKLGDFAAKVLLAAMAAAVVVWLLQLWIESPRTGLQNAIYLCILCSGGSLAYLAALAVTRALPLAELVAVWQQSAQS